MSTTRMMILGLVHWLQPVHGYDVRRELVSWDVEHWANIAPGSIYHALRKLTEDGLLEEVATEQVGNRPARTTYRMTTAGAVEFETLLRKYWWEYELPVDPFMAAFAFLSALPRAEAVSALRQRADNLDGWAESMRADQAWFDQRPPHVRWQFELAFARGEAEARWCRETAGKVEAGEGFHVGEPSVWTRERWEAARDTAE